MLEELLDHIGVEDIRPLGEEIQARCPLHEVRTGQRERHPRHWSINRRTGAHHCFSCEYSGSLIRLIMDVSRLGLWDAHQLVRRFDLDLDVDDQTPEPILDQEVAEQLEGFGMPPPRAVERRHLTMEAVLRYQVRWSREDLGWVFPINSPEGDLWGWQIKAPTFVRNHPPGIRKSKTLFGLHVLRSDVYVTLVESPLDAMYLDSLGYPAVASFGATVSDNQMRLIIERVDELILCLDNDDAGRAATKRLLDEKWHHRLPVQIFNYAELEGKDPGELTPGQIEAGMADSTIAAFW
jgi:DNA primase